MRIDTLRLKNFKKFAESTCSLHPRFTLLVGENGSGKTSILDAMAVALGIWLIEPPDTTLQSSGRNIFKKEIRLESSLIGDRMLFREHLPVVVSATGQIGESSDLTWARELRGQKTTNIEAKNALAVVRDIYERDRHGESVLCPVIAYYGAGRAWLPSNQPKPKSTKGPARRWAAFYDCLNERIRLPDLQEWFRNEALAALPTGRMRTGFQIVRRAILNCVPDADDVWFDADRKQIALSIHHEAQPFDNLSAGQKMMVALVADIAIKAVTQNTFLVPNGNSEKDSAGMQRVLQETPGVVLIDEIDVHLHPRWQRMVAENLKNTFPAIQFVCTSHSPQVIGELSPEEIRLMDTLQPPNQSFGMDSNWILQVLMGAEEQDIAVKSQLSTLFRLISERQLEEAERNIQELRSKIGNSQSIQRAASTIERVKILGR